MIRRRIISSRFHPRQHGSVNSPRPLRTMFVITSMPVGGAETLLVNMLRRMDTQAVEPEVVCLKEPGPLGEQLADEFPVHHDLIRGKRDIGVIPRLRHLFLNRKADAIITIGAGDKMFWGRLAAAAAGIPVIASALHSTGWPDGVGKLNRMLTPITDAFIAVAESHGKFLVDFERFPESKVHVIRNGVDCDRFRPQPDSRKKLRDDLGLEHDAELIGIVAALREEKNHGLVIKTLARLEKSRSALHAVIVGDGPERPKIESMAAELGVASRVHLLGTRHDTPEILAGLDLFTLCSLNEASPVSILEALACEVPVVATDVGSIKESVIPGRTGELVESQDDAGLAAAIDGLLANNNRRKTYGRAGRNLVLQTGSLNSMVLGYQQLVTSLYDRATSQLAAGPLREPAAAN